MKKEKRTRNWSTIIYPRQTEQDESTCPDNWADILGELGVKCAVSPLHDKDVNGDGTLKKPHRHVLVAFEGVKSREQAVELFDRIGGVGAEPVNSLYGMTRYLTHVDNPEKAQYSSMDVLTFGGFEYRRYASTKEDEEKETVGHIGEIMEIVQNNLIFGFSDLAEVLMTERPELFTVFRKNPYFFAHYLKSKQEIYRNALDR